MEETQHRFSWKDRVGIVTGAGSGIGHAVAKSFLEDGAFLILLDRNLDIWDDNNNSYWKKVVDVADIKSLESAFSEIAERKSEIDFAFNGAGIGGAFDKVHDYDYEDWRRVFSVNTDAVFYCMKLEIPLMLRKGGAIVNCASLLSVVGYAMDSAYVASKHAVVGLTKSAALEYAKDGIRINCVSPGFINTPMTSSYDAEKRRDLESKHAVDRFGAPDEIARSVKWLCSTDASFVCGHNLVVDGGYTIS